jgi:hypothetical protein
MYRYRDHSGGVTQFSLDRLDLPLSKIGRPIEVKGYTYWGRYDTDHAAVMVKGTRGTARFEGFSWGYSGEGPHGLRTLLMRLGLTKEAAELVAFHGPSWTTYPLAVHWRVMFEFVTDANGKVTNKPVEIRICSGLGKNQAA